MINVASSIKDTIPGELALSCIIDRARTYLVRARFHKQQEQLHIIRASNHRSSWHQYQAENHRFFAKLNRRYARLALDEAERIGADEPSYNGSRPWRGARILNGADFLFWPQYLRERTRYSGDTWLGERDARRIPK